MKYRKLGRTGLQVSEIGFGAWGIGGVTDGAIAYGPTHDAESTAALNKAHDMGVTFYDTSDLYGYGHSERLIGATLKHVRHDVIIATKVGFLDVNGAKDFSSTHIRQSLEASLTRLQTDYVDLYQLHGPSIDELREDESILDSLNKLVIEGKVRAVGISANSPDDGLAIVSEFGVKAVQVNFSLVDQRVLENGFLDLCEKQGVGVVVRTPLCFGFLTGNYSTESKFEPGDYRRRWSSEQVSRWATACHLFSSALMHDGRHTYAQSALRFCLSYPSVSTVIPGMLTKEHVEENVVASQVGPFPEIELLKMEKIYQENAFFVGG